MSDAHCAAVEGEHLFERPDWVRRVNALGETAGGPDRVVPFDVDTMCEDAVASTGLDDFGDFDGNWLARLRDLVAALDSSARMHTVGRTMARAELMRCLRTRLLLAEDVRQRPGVLAETIVSPVVVTGPARSGTSLALELLDLDPTLRGLTGGESTHPGPATAAERVERLERAEGEYELWADVQPEFRAVHDLQAAYPQECIHAQMPSFAGVFWPMVADLGGWTPDPLAAMRFHQRVLQSIQHGSDDRSWVLKTPVYLATLDLVFGLYPDAWVIHMHRDPVKTEISGASTLATVRWLRSDHVTPHGISGAGTGPILLALMARRARGELPDRIVDIHFAELMADPATAIEKAYGQMGRTFTGSHADAIDSYVSNRPRGALGRHSYTADQFGIDIDEVRTTMRPYTDGYGIELE